MIFKDLQLGRLQRNLYHLIMCSGLVANKSFGVSTSTTLMAGISALLKNTILPISNTPSFSPSTLPHPIFFSLLLPPTLQVHALNQLLSWNDYSSVFKTITVQSSDVSWLRNATVTVISLHPSPSTSLKGRFWSFLRHHQSLTHHLPCHILSPNRPRWIHINYTWNEADERFAMVQV